MLKIALGTTSSWKIQEIKRILKEAKINAEIFPIEVESGVSNQPRSENETKKGSINRAKTALKLQTSADIGLGLEIGYEPISGKYFMHGWASIVDREGNIYSEQSSTLELPNFLLKFLNDQDDVGEHIQEYKLKENSVSWKYFTEIFQYRKPFIKEASRNAILRYYFRKEY